MSARRLALGLIGLTCASAAMGAPPQPKAHAPKSPVCKGERHCAPQLAVPSDGAGGILALQRRLLSPLLP